VDSGQWTEKCAEFSIKLKTTAAGKLLMILKKLFSKSFLSRRPQTAKSPPALQAVAALGDRLEGVKSPLAGDFRSFIFSFYIIAYFSPECAVLG